MNTEVHGSTLEKIAEQSPPGFVAYRDLLARVERLESIVQDALIESKPTPSLHASPFPIIGDVAFRVAVLRGVPLHLLGSQTRIQCVADARMLAMYIIATVAPWIGHKIIADAFGLQTNSVKHAVRKFAHDIKTDDRDRSHVESLLLQFQPDQSKGGVR